MKNFKTMTKKTMPKKKMLAGATAVVALSGFVPAIDAASPTATANVGVSVVIQQAITINVGAPVDFGTIVLSAATVIGKFHIGTAGNVWSNSLTGEAGHVGGQAIGTMAINASAGVVNIALGAVQTDDNGAIEYDYLMFGGTAISSTHWLPAGSAFNVSLIGSVLSIGSRVEFISKPTPGTYNTKSFLVTVTDI